MLLYGLEVPIPGDTGGCQVVTGPRTATWHSVSIDTCTADAPARTDFSWSEGSARLRTAGQLAVDVRRDPAFRVVTSSPTPLEPVELIHPVLTFAGAVIASWTGRVALHAASVVIHGAAWLLAAHPGGGKSTAAISLGLRGHPVLADDLTVLDGRTVLAGPRSVDLRIDAGNDGPARPVGAPTTRGRWRAALGPAPAESPLGGVVLLEWGDALGVRRLAPTERLTALAVHDALGGLSRQPQMLLDLVDVPVHAVRRPRDWAVHDDALSLVEDLASARLLT